MSTLHCVLESGADLYVNEYQKIRHYRARSTEERKRRRMRRMPNRDFFTSRSARLVTRGGSLGSYERHFWLQHAVLKTRSTVL